MLGRRSGVARVSSRLGRAERPGALRYLHRPRLRGPVLLAAFEGWNDAAEAASYALAFLASSWSATPIAEVDPEEFFDFVEQRPEVRIVEGVTTRVVWPATTVMTARPPGYDRDVVLVRGPEPRLRWRTYAETLVRLARALRAELVLTLGAYLAEVPHSRPIAVTASASDERLLDRHRLDRTDYEGPTGIVGVLNVALAEAGVPAAALWAGVPYYAPPVSATAALALVARVEQVMGLRVETSRLEEEAAAYDRRLDELVAEDENVAAYVAHLEEMEPETGGEPSLDRLAAEIERYLREHRSR